MTSPTIRRTDLIQGPPGPASTVPGPPPVTTTTANFTQPASGQTVSVAVNTTSFLVADQAVFVEGAGDYVVDSITDSAHMVLRNLDTPGSAALGTVILSGKKVTCNGYPGAGTEITGQTTDATPLDLAFDLSWVVNLTTFRLDVVVVAGSSADDATFTLSGLFHKDAGGTITQIGSAQPPGGAIASSGATSWTGSLTVSSQNVNAHVTGAVSTTINWAALAQIVRVVKS